MSAGPLSPFYFFCFSLFGDFMDKIAPLLEQLAAKFGTTVEHLWPHLVGHARVTAIVWTTFGILTVLSGLIPLKGYLDLRDKDHYGVGEERALRVAAFIALLLIGCAIVCFSIPDIVYPEAAAIKSLISDLKPSSN
jgi:hypothetical protein